jgi:hypothetical protein
MEYLDRYFWFISGAVALINVAIWRRRLADVVATGRITQDESDRFVRGAIIAITVAVLVLGLTSLIVPTRPHCVRPFAASDPGSVVLSVVTVVAWLATLYWVWIGSGADFLSRAGGVLVTRLNPSRTYSPLTVRLFITALVLISAVGSLVVTRGEPFLPICG